MITIQVMGGLGNQMFQYAMGRSLAHDLDEELQLDASWYSTVLRKPSGSPRLFLLPYFHTRGKVIRFSPLGKVLDFSLDKIPNPFMVKSKITKRIYECDVQNKLLSLNEYKNPTYCGFWQNELYFKHNSDLIRDDFIVTSSPYGLNAKYCRVIDSVESVGIHVRRGDYLSPINSSFGTLKLSYYTDAINFIGDNVDNPVFFVFSDDIAWARENLRIPYPAYYMDHNNEECAYEDMRLMELCKHFIIANSTFSWWGAWLGANQAGGYVVAPRTFHKLKSETTIIPNNWVRIDNTHD